MVLIGVLVGICIFAIYVVALKMLFKAFKINPLLHLVAMYLLVDLSKGIITIFPESWTVKQIDTPVKIEGTVGFLLRLNNPQMSIYDVAMSVLFFCFCLLFIYKVGVKRYLKSKNPKETSSI